MRLSDPQTGSNEDTVETLELQIDDEIPNGEGNDS